MWKKRTEKKILRPLKKKNILKCQISIRVEAMLPNFLCTKNCTKITKIKNGFIGGVSSSIFYVKIRRCFLNRIKNAKIRLNPRDYILAYLSKRENFKIRLDFPHLSHYQGTCNSIIFCTQIDFLNTSEHFSVPVSSFELLYEPQKYLSNLFLHRKVVSPTVLRELLVSSSKPFWTPVSEFLWLNVAQNSSLLKKDGDFWAYAKWGFFLTGITAGS